MRGLLDRIRRQDCRHHWHGTAGSWRCCWCPDTDTAQLQPPSRVRSCWHLESFLTGELALPPARRFGRRRQTRRRDGVTAPRR